MFYDLFADGCYEFAYNNKLVPTDAEAQKLLGARETILKIVFLYKQWKLI